MSENIKTDVEIDVSVDGTASLRQASDAIGAISDSLRDVSRALGSAISQFDRLEKSMSGATSRSKAVTQTSATTTKSFQDQEAAAKALDASIGRLYENRNNPSVGVTAPSIDATSKQGRDIANGRIAAEAAANAKALELEAAASDRAARASAHNQQQLQNLRDNYGRVTEANTTFRNAQDVSAEHAERFNSRLAQTRYAFYDVGIGAAIAGAALLKFSSSVYSTAIDFESDFLNIVRTSQLTGSAIGMLRDDFYELAQSIPVSFSDLAEIGTLGGQLGIAGGDLASFTKTVAQFSATTDVTVDAAATAFGRLNALLPDVQGNFSALASSILKVGVNSVATESSIIRTAVQISAMSRYAGLTADQVVGLAGAFASIAVPPELSRGTVTRLFTLMSRAVSEGGEQLDKFAQVAGVSSEKFASSFGTSEFGDTFLKFVNGLKTNTSDANTALIDLGISSVRDRPALLNLASAASSAGEAGKLLNQTFSDGASGFKDNTELARQYGIISESVASKIQKLSNNFDVFMATIGNGGSILGGFVDALSDMFKQLTEFASSPGGNFLLQAGVVLTAIAGALALITSVAAFAVGGIIAAASSVTALGIDSSVTIGSLAGLTTALTTAGGAGAIAAKGIGLVTLATKGLGIAMAVLAAVAILPPLTTELEKWADGIRGIDRGLVPAVDRLKAANERMVASSVKTTQAVSSYSGGTYNAGLAVEQLSIKAQAASRDTDILWRSLTNGSNSNSDLQRDFQATEDSLVAFAEAGDTDQLTQRLNYVGEAFGKTAKEVVAGMPELDGALEYNQLQLKKNADGTYEVTKKITEFSSEADVAAVHAENLASQLGLVPDELTALQTNLTTGSGGFVNFGDLIQRVQDQTRGFAEKTSKEVYGSIDSWQEFYDGSSVNIQAFMTLLDQQIANQSAWADDLAELTARGATAFVTELAKMGPEGAPLAAAAVQLTADELYKLEDDARLAAFLASDAFAQEFVDNTPALMAAYRSGGIAAVQELIKTQRENPLPPIPVTVDVDPATGQVNDFVALVQGKRVGIFVDLEPGNALNASTFSSGSNLTVKLDKVPTFAEGGAIRGAGTATSDSIPAYLSNGEHVIKSSSASSLGTPLLNFMNRYGRLPGFASGGPVSGGDSSQFPASMNLGAFERKLMRQMASQPAPIVVLDDVAIAKAANRGNNQLGNRSSN